MNTRILADGDLLINRLRHHLGDNDNQTPPNVSLQWLLTVQYAVIAASFVIVSPTIVGRGYVALRYD